MSSMLESLESQMVGLSIDKEGLDSQVKDGELTQTATGKTAETQSASPRLRFNSLTLNELSEELDRQTREAQRLQEEVENATREALERFGCIADCSPEQSNHKHVFDISHQQTVKLPLSCGVDRDMNQFGEEDLETALDSQQLLFSQLNKTTNQPEQEPSGLQDAVINLQAELHNVQMAKETLSDLRLKDSKKHVDEMEKMLCMLEDFQKAKRSEDQKRPETQDQEEELNRKLETLERTLKEAKQTLDEKQWDHSSNTYNKSTNIQRLQSVTADYNSFLCKMVSHQPEEQHGHKSYNGVNNDDRIQDLIINLGQEVALLTDKLNSSKDSGLTLSVKLQLLKNLAEKQASLHKSHISEMESTISSHKDKVCCLEQQLTEVQTRLYEVQREKEQSLQETRALQSQLCQVQRCSEQQQREHQEEVKVLRGQLELTREQLHRAGEEKTNLLEQRAQEGSHFQELLQEKDEELWAKQQVTQQHLARLEEAQSRCQTLQAEQETLILELNDKEKIIGALKLQMESSIQMTAQHRCNVARLNQESSLLSNQLNQSLLNIQKLKAELDRRTSSLAAAELEKRRLQASVTEESLEKQRLNTQVELQRMKLLTLTKEHAELQRLHSCRKEEHRGVVQKLQTQLRNAGDELQQTRNTVRSLQRADGYGMEVALEMQKEVTARREHVDSLQCRIQHLEENAEKLHQEKRHQNLETRPHLQELVLIREEKKQLINELEALQSKDQQLKERISELEAILHKMSESFVNCRDFIQLQEQEFFRLKLQHALNLKDLQGQNLCSSLIVPPPDLDSPTSAALAAPPPSQHASEAQIKSKKQPRSPANLLDSPDKDVRGVISEKLRPHTVDSGIHRRRSAPERENRTTFFDKVNEGKSASRLRSRTCGSEPRFLNTAQSNRKAISTSVIQASSPATTVKFTSFLQPLSPGRKSPVYSLLTSDPAR